MVERLISAKTKENEEEVEQSLRPRRLAEYIGQEKLK
jgi:Holliday junction resolvasome RuvABC ATP-dependent DNA helicase subunit